MSEQRILFLGSKAAGLRLAGILARSLPRNVLTAVICPNDVNDARSMLPDFQALAIDVGIELHVANSVGETIDLIDRYRPTTIIVHGWYQMIPVDRFPNIQFLGFHYSPLPRYRGNAPLVWQIIAGEAEIGVSMFELVEEMDAGRLYAQARAPLARDETIADALVKADNLAGEIIERFLADWSAKSVALRPQPIIEPSYCGLRLPGDGLIDWTWAGHRIHDFVRAQSRPYPGAFTTLPDGNRLVVWRTELEPRVFFGAPGGVAEIASGHVVITAGSGAIRLIEVEATPKLPQSAPAVLRSLKTRLGRT